MKAIIHLDVPEWQIGQNVTVYFPDTMQKKGICELLKEQEAAEPILIGKEGNPLSFVVCGDCGEPLYGRMNINYCAHCGKKMKWYESWKTD